MLKTTLCYCPRIRRGGYLLYDSFIDLEKIKYTILANCYGVYDSQALV